jgi:hypothetical protein
MKLLYPSAFPVEEPAEAHPAPAQAQPMLYENPDRSSDFLYSNS